MASNPQQAGDFRLLPVEERNTYLFVLNWPVHSTGGVNEVVLGLAHELQVRSNYRPLVLIAAGDESNRPPKARGIEVMYHRLREPIVPGIGLRSFVGFLATLPTEIRSLSALIRTHKIEVINIHFPGLEGYVFLVLKAFRLFRGKFLLSFHGADLTAARQATWLCRTMWRYLISHADVVVACSEALRREVQMFAPKANTVTVHNGMDFGLFSHVRSVHRERRSILHIGKYEFKKAHDILLRAFQLLLQAVPGVSLVLVGAPGPELESVRNLISQFRLEESVEIHVNVPHEHLPKFMDRADLFVLPSRSEGLPIVLLEAGAAGLPVVATRVSGIPELIEDGVTGTLVPPDDFAALEAAMRRMLTDSQLADRLARTWHERATAGWSWERTCRQYLDLVKGAR